ncbi:MAG: hypothetical protein Q4D88_05155 [Anaerococcus sp.]|nr:hypothetical protein [Anaerococcus sp.]
MDKYRIVETLKNHVNKNIGFIEETRLKDFNKDFALRFHYESTKIEGNSLSLEEVKTLLVDQRSLAGVSLREIF